MERRDETRRDGSRHPAGSVRASTDATPSRFSLAGRGAPHVPADHRHVKRTSMVPCQKQVPCLARSLGLDASSAKPSHGWDPAVTGTHGRAAFRRVVPEGKANAFRRLSKLTRRTVTPRPTKRSDCLRNHVQGKPELHLMIPFSESRPDARDGAGFGVWAFVRRRQNRFAFRP